MKVGSITVPTPTRSAAGKRREKGRKKKSIKDFLYAVPFQHRRTAPVTSNSVPLPSQISIFRKILRVSLSIPKSTGKFYLTGYNKCVWQFLERRSYYRFLRDNIRNQITHGIRLYIKNIEIFFKERARSGGKKKEFTYVDPKLGWAGHMARLVPSSSNFVPFSVCCFPVCIGSADRSCSSGILAQHSRTES